MQKIERFFGAMLCVLGGLVLVGWWLHIPFLIRLVPGYIAMVPNTALSFVLSGAALAIQASSPVRQCCWRLGLAATVFIIACVVLLQHLLDADFGVDSWISSIWLTDDNPHPGRMAPQTTVAFIGSSVVFSLLTTRVRLFTDVAIHAVLILIGTVGVVGVVGYLLDVGLFYSWYQHTAIAVHTGGGLVLLVIGLWSAWLSWRNQTNADSVVHTFGGITAITLVMAAVLIAGLFSFVSLASRTEILMREHLEGALRSQMRAVRSEIQSGLEYSESVTHRPVTLQNIRILNTDSAHQAARQFLKSTTEILVRQNLSAVALHGLNGAPYASAGTFEEAPKFDAALGSDARLMWSNGFLLRRRLSLVADGQPVGFAIVEMRLPRLPDVLTDVFYLGKSAETGMCAPAGAEAMQCIPTRHRDTPFKTARSMQRAPLPLAHALDGESGFVRARDYRRQEVLAVYSPVEPYVLGIVVKVDSAEFNAPVRQQFQKVIGLLSIFVVGIAWALRRRAPSSGQ